MIQPSKPLFPVITVGYVGGSDSWISVVETVWEDQYGPPVYLARISRHGDSSDFQELFNDKRVVKDSTKPPALVCCSDEIDTEFIASIGFDTSWVRVVSGSGAAAEELARACVTAPLQELETVLRKLASERRLRFPVTLGALGRRAGGELALEDRELVALGLSVWYGSQQLDDLRAERPRRILPTEPPEDESWESEFWGEQDPMIEALNIIKAKNGR